MSSTRSHNIQFDATFPHEYECKQLEELPSNQELHYYPSGSTSGRDGLLVLVTPKSCKSWLGMFSFGHTSPKGKTGLYSWPTPDRLCVVSLGIGYLVSVKEPTEYEMIEVEPILEVLPIEEREIVVFANYTELFAYGKAGLAWKSMRIAWDGLKITKVHSEFVEGEFWNPQTEAITSFRVRLADGKTEGGVDEQ